MTEREKLLKQIMAYNFAAIEWNLFLNTHPYDREAISMFKKMVEKTKELRKEYLTKYEPLEAWESTNPNYFEWVEEPWPWDKY